MTFVEFYDKSHIENICASLCFETDTVVLIGGDKKEMRKRAERYSAFMKNRGRNVQFVCRSVNRYDLDSVVASLVSVIGEFGDCAFDITGGDETLLVALGIVFERYRGKNVQLHRFNIKSGTFYDVDSMSKAEKVCVEPKLTVEEYVSLYGGEIISGGERNSTLGWDLNEDFRKDVELMWGICAANMRTWNSQITNFQYASELADKKEPDRDDKLTVTVKMSDFNKYLSEHSAKYCGSQDLIHDLTEAGQISGFRSDSDRLTVTFKNEQVKRCLTKAGQILELRIFIAAASSTEPDSSYTYADAMTGVYINWKGADASDGASNDDHNYVPAVINEIDVMLIHGLVPVFVSCKNGYVDMDELYKLDSVSKRFGGKYSRKVLVAANLDRDHHGNTVRERAGELGIKVVEDLVDLDFDDMLELTRSFWIY